MQLPILMGQQPKAIKIITYQRQDSQAEDYGSEKGKTCSKTRSEMGPLKETCDTFSLLSSLWRAEWLPALNPNLTSGLR